MTRAPDHDATAASKPNIEWLPSPFEPVGGAPFITRKFGTYVEMNYDGVIQYAGLRWYRVHNGFSGKGDRLDFVADVPGVSVSVTNNLGRGFAQGRQGWGWYGTLTFAEAADSAIESALNHSLHRQREVAKTLSDLTEASLCLATAKARTHG